MKALIILIIAWLLFGPLGIILALAGVVGYWVFFVAMVKDAVKQDTIRLRKEPRL